MDTHRDNEGQGVNGLVMICGFVGGGGLAVALAQVVRWEGREAALVAADGSTAQLTAVSLCLLVSSALVMAALAVQEAAAADAAADTSGSGSSTRELTSTKLDEAIKTIM